MGRIEVKCRKEGKVEGMKKWRVERKEGRERMEEDEQDDIHSWQFRLCGDVFLTYLVTTCGLPLYHHRLTWQPSMRRRLALMPVTRPPSRSWTNSSQVSHILCNTSIANSIV